MFRFTAIASSVLLSAMIAAPVSMMATATEQDQRQARDRERQAQTEDRDVKQFEGLVVDLYHYMKHKDRKIDEYPDREVAGQNHGGPIGLLIKDEGIIRTTTKVRVVLFEQNPEMPRPGQQPRDRDRNSNGEQDRPGQDRAPRDRAGEQVRQQLQQAVGQRIRITGYELERDDLTAIVVREMERQRPDRERDRDRE